MGCVKHEVNGWVSPKACSARLLEMRPAGQLQCRALLARAVAPAGGALVSPLAGFPHPPQNGCALILVLGHPEPEAALPRLERRRRGRIRLPIFRVYERCRLHWRRKSFCRLRGLVSKWC